MADYTASLPINYQDRFDCCDLGRLAVKAVANAGRDFDSPLVCPFDHMSIFSGASRTLFALATS